MKKVKDDSLLLFVVDEFGDLQPNLEIIQGKKERIENDTGLSIPREEPKHNNLQDTNAVVYGQESGALRAENNRTLDLSLSKDLSNLRSFRSSLFSSTASEDGTKDTKEQESQRTTSKRNYSNGDTTRSTDRSSVLSNSVSASIKPSIQRFDKRGNAGGLVRERGYSYGNTVSSRTNDFTDDRQSSTGSRRGALQRVSRKDRQDIGLSLFEERRLGQEVNQEHREHNELKSLERTDTRIRERNDGDSRGDKVDFSLDKKIKNKEI
ncbi:hypothetical protein [Campylobacter avium]|uniref:hypothetical protein n=1 Tax=Campylobacter avium TaxID=522485 RepID=UPI002355E098|nr:hypothetical protein [Campylobacter avium]